MIDHAIAAIKAQAGPCARHFYEQGQSQDAKVHNWVLKWLLWHVCRYRDWRNRKNRGASTAAATSAALASGAGGGSAYAAGGGGGAAGNQNLNPGSRRSRRRRVGRTRGEGERTLS